MTNHFNNVVDYDPEPTGWFNSADIDKAKLEKKNGEEAAKAHNLSKAALFPVNLAYWQKVVELLKRRHIQCVMVRLPAHPTYNMNLDKGLMDKFKLALRQFVQAKGIAYFDYTEDKRFGTEDYTFMIDHLNPLGAEKFSRILNQEVLQGYFK